MKLISPNPKPKNAGYLTVGNRVPFLRQESGGCPVTLLSPDRRPQNLLGPLNLLGIHSGAPLL
jgi:hypothetical protein